MIERKQLLERVSRSTKDFQVTALLGPRPCGKMTLSRAFEVSRENYFDREDPPDQARLANPRDVLSPLKNLIVIDEFQTLPELFPILRVLSDRKPNPARFLILGSASAGRGAVVSQTRNHSGRKGADTTIFKETTIGRLRD